MLENEVDFKHERKGSDVHDMTQISYAANERRMGPSRYLSYARIEVYVCVLA
jgi:hypothetical protein